MKLTLLDYQVEGVQRLHELNGRALLCDSMGLGKTVQFLQWLKETPQARPAIVVVPAHLKQHWKKEAKKFFNIDCTVLYGMSPYVLDERKNRVVIINYDILASWLSYLRRLRPKVIGGDEIQYISNLRAKRTKAFRILCKGVPHVVGISGTPLMSRPFELFPILNILRPEDFASPFSFGHEFCDATRTFGRWQFTGARNCKKLHRIISPFMIRRLKKDVMSQLPPKRRSVVPLDIEDRKEYEEAEADIIAWLAKTDMAKAGRAALDIRTRFTYLKHLAAVLKLKSVYGWIDDYLESSDGKLLCGTIHRDVIGPLYERYADKAVFIHGGHGEKHRQRAERLYREDKKVRILFGQNRACGTGLNLPETNAVAMIEVPWTPAACVQFEDRAHRMTSKHAIDVYYLVAFDTIEEVLCEKIQNKDMVTSAIMDGFSKMPGCLEILNMLAQELGRKSRKT